MAFYRSLAAGLLLLAAGLPAQADDAATVQINSIRSPELKPYRVMLAGLDAFDEYHALAPNTHELRFKLRLRSGAPTDATMDHLALRIAGNETSVPVALDAGQVHLAAHRGPGRRQRRSAAEPEKGQLPLGRGCAQRRPAGQYAAARRLPA